MRLIGALTASFKVTLIDPHRITPCRSPGGNGQDSGLGSRFRAWGFGFGVWGLGFGVWGLGLGGAVGPRAFRL